jgi:hypothetical protein
MLSSPMELPRSREDLSRSPHGLAGDAADLAPEP